MGLEGITQNTDVRGNTRPELPPLGGRYVPFVHAVYAVLARQLHSVPPVCARTPTADGTVGTISSSAYVVTGAWKMNIAESNMLMMVYIIFELLLGFFIMPSSTLKNEIINLLTL